MFNIFLHAVFIVFVLLNATISIPSEENWYIKIIIYLKPVPKKIN